MANIASLLKSEIARIARKELKSQMEATRRSVSQQRTEIASLKRRVQELTAEVSRLKKQSPTHSGEQDAPSGATASRFSAKGLASHRQRLGLSADAYGKLVGASALSIYKWESGKAKPQARFASALIAIRSLGKKEVAKRIHALP